MGFTEAIESGFRRYATFSGRAPRSEFWYFQLFIVLITIVSGLVDELLVGYELLSLIFGLLTFLPAVSVTVRRLHDIGRTGWWWWIWLIPVVGLIVIVVFGCTKGTLGENKYGHDPLAARA